MKTIAHIILAAALLPLPLVAVDNLVVSAQIDGHSQLVVKRDQFYWDHMEYARPGRHLANLPTLLNGYPWYPRWPTADDNEPGPSAPRYLATLFSTNGVTLSKEAGRGPVTIVQQPAEENDFTLIIDFDDTEPHGPDRYTITLAGLSVMTPPFLTVQVASVAISWPTETNRLYQLQFMSATSSNAWIDLTAPIQGYGTNALFIDSVLGEPHRAYRVIPLP